MKLRHLPQEARANLIIHLVSHDTSGVHRMHFDAMPSAPRGNLCRKCNMLHYDASRHERFAKVLKSWTSSRRLVLSWWFVGWSSVQIPAHPHNLLALYPVSAGQDRFFEIIHAFRLFRGRLTFSAYVHPADRNRPAKHSGVEMQENPKEGNTRCRFLRIIPAFNSLCMHILRNVPFANVLYWTYVHIDINPEIGRGLSCAWQSFAVVGFDPDLFGPAVIHASIATYFGQGKTSWPFLPLSYFFLHHRARNRRGTKAQGISSTSWLSQSQTGSCSTLSNVSTQSKTGGSGLAYILHATPTPWTSCSVWQHHSPWLHGSRSMLSSRLRRGEGNLSRIDFIHVRLSLFPTSSKVENIPSSLNLKSGLSQ